VQIVEHIAPLKAAINSLREKGNSIGFVPTMGALHDGHASLIRQSVKETDISVVSIFVNPTQFNDTTDLKKYPRDLHSDVKILQNILRTDDLVFAPENKEIYPERDTRIFDFGQLDKIMEGKFRHGHFNGVAQVVSKLFDIVTPDKAYFGEKDYQQLAIIKKMVQQESLPVNIVSCPIIREEDGLAMSSRNLRLSTEERGKALALRRGLLLALATFRHGERESCRLVSLVEQEFEGLSDTAVEYVSLVEDDELRELPDALEQGCRILAAVRVGEIRLIDNVALIPRP